MRVRSLKDESWEEDLRIALRGSMVTSLRFATPTPIPTPDRTAFEVLDPRSSPLDPKS